MSRQKWAAIVYGRSYHLDFRFITIPQDFGDREIAWASPYILATTRKARNLANFPRWSLFKNESHCVVGVTCMVRDLIGKLGDDFDVMAKDDLGRPLYVFVGYVTQLSLGKDLDDFPAYIGIDLNGFKPLYQEIKKVWLLRDYDNRKPLLSEYKPLNREIELTNPFSKIGQIAELNDRQKYPDKTFVWRHSPEKDRELWLETARCSQATSICLNVKEKYLSNSPFLNQTVTNIDRFTIEERLIDKSDRSSSQPSYSNSHLSFKQKISTRAKEDIDLTIRQAAKLTTSGQEIISNFNRSNLEQKAEQTDLSINGMDDVDDFGFKNKENPVSSQKQDWF